MRNVSCSCRGSKAVTPLGIDYICQRKVKIVVKLLFQLKKWNHLLEVFLCALFTIKNDTLPESCSLICLPLEWCVSNLSLSLWLGLGVFSVLSIGHKLIMISDLSNLVFLKLCFEGLLNMILLQTEFRWKTSRSGIELEIYRFF